MSDSGGHRSRSLPRSGLSVGPLDEAAIVLLGALQGVCLPAIEQFKNLERIAFATTRNYTLAGPSGKALYSSRENFNKTVTIGRPLLGASRSTEKILLHSYVSMGT
jgi:hypothetical protein